LPKAHTCSFRVQASTRRGAERAGVAKPTIVVLEGDETGQELLVDALRVIDPDVIGIELNLEHYDLSLAKRRETKNAVVHEAAAAMKRAGLGLKAATITPEIKGDVGSPNAILRREIDGKVIVRTGRRLPGIRPIGGIHSPISIVRMAVGDAYGATEWRERDGEDEIAFRTERISRSVCRLVSEYAFVHARRTHSKVFGGPKYTVSPVYEGLLKEEMDAAAARYPDVVYEPQLIDATYALLISSAGDPMVIPSLNRDGDCLSDLVMQLFGSIAGAESVLMAFDQSLKPSCVMAEAPHGTAPRLFGKNVANPMAMILAEAALLAHVADPRGPNASRAIYESVLEAVHGGVATSDLGGHASTTEFTNAVIAKVKSKLDVWATL
jgi:isocitrate/isopropylmalate dehydrogenase